MKIVYINGYKGENSTKPQKFSKLLATEVKHYKLLFENNTVNKKDLDTNFINDGQDIDLIIASSTGGYIARYYSFKYNIPLVSLNPVVDIEETFRDLDCELKLPEKFKDLNDLPVCNLVLLNQDDALIDYKKSIKILEDKAKIIIFKEGGHRFSNLHETVEPIQNFIREFLHV